MPSSRALEERLKGFCLSLSKKDKILIIHHNDADGLCSALIAAKAIEKISGKKPEKVIAYGYNSRENDAKMLKKIAREKPDKIIVLDFSIDYNPEFAKELENNCKKMLVIDHHKVSLDLNSEKTVFLKAAYFSEMQPSNYANSKLTFDLMQKIVNISEYAWIACVGIFGDKAQNAWKEFIEETAKKSRLQIKEMREAAEMISAVETLKRKEFEGLFEEFYSIKEPKEILKSRYFRYLEKFEKILKEWTKKFEKQHKENKELELLYYIINPKENLKSALINAACEIHPNKTVIIFQQVDGKHLSVSARRKDFKIKMNDLLENAIKDIPDARAGGHIPAAGGSIPKKYFPEFIQKIEKELQKQMKKA